VSACVILISKTPTQGPSFRWNGLQNSPAGQVAKSGDEDSRGGAIQSPPPEHRPGGPYFRADVSEINELQERTTLSETLIQSIGILFKISLSMGKPLPEELLKTLDKIDHPGRLADLIAITLHLGLKEQQEILKPSIPWND